jgi:hypothetical protein
MMQKARAYVRKRMMKRRECDARKSGNEISGECMVVI